MYRNILTGVWILLMSLSMLVGVLVPFQGVVIGVVGIVAGFFWIAKK